MTPGYSRSLLHISYYGRHQATQCAITVPRSGGKPQLNRASESAHFGCGLMWQPADAKYRARSPDEDRGSTQTAALPHTLVFKANHSHKLRMVFKANHSHKLRMVFCVTPSTGVRNMWMFGFEGGYWKHVDVRIRG